MELAASPAPARPSDTRTVLAFVAAALAAPPILITIMIPLSMALKGETVTGAMVMLLFVAPLSMGFGLIGSSLALVLSIGALDAVRHWLPVTNRQRAVLSGGLAGALHLGVALISIDPLWPKGLGFWTGTWFTAGMVKEHPVAVVIACLLAGGAAGLIYGSLRRWPEQTRG
jgi:hypothetical protein